MAKRKEGQPAGGDSASADELFEWHEPPKTRNGASIAFPLRTLKTIIWSIDWEITDEVLLQLNEELDRLKQFYQDDKTIIKFLQLLEAVGKYIKKRKGKSHPESVILLRELFNELERIVFLIGMSEVERKARLRKQIQEFIALKKKLAALREAGGSPAPVKPAPPKAAPVAKKPPAAAKKTPPEIKKPPAEVKISATETKKKTAPEFNPEAFRRIILDEVAVLVREEIKKLKAELKEMLKGISKN
ncbi:MAG: hypothetical protein AB1724_16910 [Thermodesulfobacteriota bacterium]